MSNTGVSSLDKGVQKTKEWMNEIQDELGWNDEQKVYIATKTVLQALRDRLHPSEAIDLGAQFPTLMRGFYYEGYHPSWKPEKIKNPDEFYNMVREKSSDSSFPAEEATKGVLSVIRKRVSQGEIEDILDTMPKNLKSIWVTPVNTEEAEA